MPVTTRLADVRSRVFAAVYDPMMRPAEKGELGRLRDEVVGGARGAVLEIGACLSTRFARTFAREARYITVDEPAIAELRRELFDGDADALLQLSGHLEKADWLTRVLAPRRAVCVILEGVLSALHPADSVAMLDNLATQLRPGSRVIATFSEGAQLTPAQGASLRLACGASSVCYPGLRTREVSSRMVVAEAS